MSVQAIITKATGYALPDRIRMMALYENKTVEGYTKWIPSKWNDPNCNYNEADVYYDNSPVTKWNLKEIRWLDITGLGLFNYGCIHSYGCTTGGFFGDPRDCPNWDSAAGSAKWNIPIRAYNSTKPTAPNVIVTPQSGALNIKWEAVTNVEIFAYKVDIFDGSTLVVGGFTEDTLRNITVGGLTNGKEYTVRVRAASHSYELGPETVKTATPVGATNPQVYNILTTPESPKVGELLTIKAQIANTGPSGKVSAIFYEDGMQINSRETTLDTFPAGGLWEPTVTHTMPNRTITITVKAFGWDGTKYVLTDTKSITRTPAAPPCTGVTLTPYTISIKEGQKVGFTATVTPIRTDFDVQLRDDTGRTLTTCRTDANGVCPLIWDSAGKPPGTYRFRAFVPEGNCQSPYSVVEVAPAIRQWNVNIYVRDKNTNNPIEGAGVTVGTQTKATDTSGLAQFRVDQGAIDITISKAGYNTFTTVEFVYSDSTFNYTLAPVGIAKGSIQFVSVPSGAEIFLDGADTGVKTPYTITDIPAGEHAFCLKLTGYNDTCGEVTVVGGATIPVYATLTPVTPTTGSLNITSAPGGAAIYIDDALQERLTPATITNITPGSHTVKLTKEGYEDFSGTVEIAAGITTYFSATLTIKPGIGSLEITSTPAGARVYIDDQDMELETPATVTNIPTGEHTYKLVLAGYKDAADTFTIEDGKTSTVEVVLEKTEAEKALSGAGLGLIAALAVAGLATYIVSRD